MGMIVIFGGRSGDQVALNDAWGLRRHRSGAWDWVKAPYKGEKDPPLARYQHSSLFVGSAMVVLGGRTNNVGENVGMEVYDTETSEWYKMSTIQRFRHASWVVDKFIYVHGGFEHDSPNVPTDTIAKINILKTFQTHDSLYQKASSLLGSLNEKTTTSSLTSPDTSMDSGSNSKSTSPQSYSPNTSYDNMYKSSTNSYNTNYTLKNDKLQNLYGSSNNKTSNEKNFQFSKEVYVAGYDAKGDNLIKQKISIDKFGEDRLGMTGKQTNKYSNSTLNQSSNNPQNIASLFLGKLLQPKTYINFDSNSGFDFKPEHIIALCNQAQAVLETQSMVLRVQSPIKIYGDIHGQYSDLMRFFDLFGAPCQGNQEGDIESFDYLFLGDFVDRGSHSLETVCLLLALKVKYPDQIYLIRGNHEDKWINNGFGFSDECANRLGEDPTDEDSVFNRVNRLFEWLPLAAVIDNKIICLHGGIGSTLADVEDIEKLQRPLEVIHEVSTPEQQLVVDILWSDPTDSDTEYGIQSNTIRDPGGTGNIVKFGPDRVQKFLQNNGLSLVIRAHECVMDGFERFAGGQLITVFSATDYCGKHKNAGAVLILKKNFEIIPKLIYPQNANNNNWIEDDDALKKRPPTPPRWKNNNIRKTSFE
jgi:diadenosine tetraphosphatase ApaH/serine/threonine PP2A family protein phosphatase